MTDMTPFSRAQMQTQVYSDTVEQLAALTECGRPNTVLRTLISLASLAQQSAAEAGVVVNLTIPSSFDVITNDHIDESGEDRPEIGRIDIASNQTFLSTHRNNVATLQAVLV